MQNVKKDISLIKEHILSNCTDMLNEPEGMLEFPFLSPDAACYKKNMWDWDSMLTSKALALVYKITKDKKLKQKIKACQEGTIRNFLSAMDDKTGWIPILLAPEMPKDDLVPDNVGNVNMHKPVIAQHLNFLMDFYKYIPSFAKEAFEKIKKFNKLYFDTQLHEETGLFFWHDDAIIGEDNDPACYFRPRRSCASIFLNAFMYEELMSLSKIAKRLKLKDDEKDFLNKAKNLKDKIQKYMWDNWLGFYYSCDINLLPKNTVSLFKLGATMLQLHKSSPRQWDCLLMRIESWSGLIAMWAGIPDKAQATRILKEHLENKKTLCCKWGIRSMSKLEPMFDLSATGNPSCAIGPLWPKVNYFAFASLARYGFKKQASLIAKKTISLIANDIRKSGTTHEYYHPDTGKPIMNPGFENWNYLVLNMADYLENNQL